MKRIFYWFRSFKKVETIEQAKKIGLKHITNIFGDGINILNCRSLWSDKYGNNYRCEQLLAEGKDEVMEVLKKSNPELFANNKVEEIKMGSTIGTFDLQIDEKPNGYVVRLNSPEKCVLRICGIPKEFVYDKNGKMREYIDIAMPPKQKLPRQ